MIATHTNPDWDSIAAVWLLLRYGGLASAKVAFVNTGNPDPAILENALAVVDTGKELEPTLLRFDHHHLPGQEANDTCATRQVWFYLANEGREVQHLEPLINLIFCGDTGRKEFGANWSREIGIHALLSGYKLWLSETTGKPVSDEQVMAWGFGILDSLDIRLKNQAKIKAELADKVIYKSAGDGLLWAIRHGSAGSSFAAFEQGARLVVFEGEPLEVEGGTTYPIGIMRAGEWTEPNAGDLVRKALEVIGYDLVSGAPGNYQFESACRDELRRWFLHPAGFFGGRGTAKAPVFEPVTVDLGLLARLIDSVWQR